MMLWLNGALLPADVARIDPADRGFTLGDGVFETIRVEAGLARHLPRHLARMRDGLAVFGIPFAATDEAVASAITTVLEANGLQDAVIRLTISRGVAARGVLPVGTGAPTVLITCGALPAPLPPSRLIIATRTRRNEWSPLSRIKSLNYLDNILARMEASERGADDALLLNTQGFVAEATAANLVLFADARFVTPPLSAGALPGIARGLLIARAGVEEADIRPDDPAKAEGAFLCNSLGLRAVADIGGVTLPLRLDLGEVLAAALR